MSKTKLFFLLFVIASTIAVSSYTVANAQIHEESRYLPPPPPFGPNPHGTISSSPITPPAPSDEFEEQLNNMMGVPYNGTDGELVTPEGFDPGEKEYPEIVSFSFEGAVLTCSDNVNMPVDQREHRNFNPHTDYRIFHDNSYKSDNTFQILNGEPRRSNDRSLPSGERLHVEIFHLDIKDGIYHGVGFAYGIPCVNNTEKIHTLDIFGDCDGSEMHMTVRSENSWSIASNDASTHAACITAPPPKHYNSTGQ